MAYDLTKPLVIGISSRALFDLEEENRIFVEQGLAAYADYQVQNEDKPLQPGAGFELVRAFLRLNQFAPERRLVEVVIMSRNLGCKPSICYYIVKEKKLQVTFVGLYVQNTMFGPRKNFNKLDTQMSLTALHIL